MTGDRPHQRGLPHAVAAEHGKRRPALQREADVFDDDRRAVAGGDVREPQDVSHGRTRRGRGRGPRACSRISAGVPSTRISPATRTATRRGKAKHDVDVVLDQQDGHRRRQLRDGVEDDGDVGAQARPAAGSSSSRIRGSSASAIASSTIRCTPYGSNSTWRRRSSCRRSVARISDTRASTLCAFAAVRPQAPGHSAMLGDRQRDVLLDGQAAKQAGDLERAPDARLDPRGLRHRRHVAARDANLAAARRQPSGDQIDQRRLSGPVGSDQRAAGALFQLKADVAYDVERSELLRDAAHVQHAHGRLPVRRVETALTHAVRPPGARKTIASSSRPIHRYQFAGSSRAR